MRRNGRRCRYENGAKKRKGGNREGMKGETERSDKILQEEEKEREVEKGNV